MKCTECKKYDDCRTGSGLVWPCGAFVSNKTMTNADRIRAMTDEELEKTFAIDFATCPPDVGEDKWCDKDDDCKQCWLEWLKLPYGGAEG